MGLLFNIMQVEMGCVTFVSTQHNTFIKCAIRVVNGPSRASPAHFYLAYGHNGLGIMDY